MYLPGVPGCTGGKVGRDAREGGELPEYGYWRQVAEIEQFGILTVHNIKN